MRTLLRVLRFLFDRTAGPPNHLVARWIYLRCLGLIYFSAFFSLLFQIRGMIGVRGVLPAGEFMQGLAPLGAKRFVLAPSVLWMGSGDRALMALCWVGLLASVAVTLNVLPRMALVICFVCFLSFVGVSQDFGQYQSDGMLLEAGFLSLFVAPAGVRPGLGKRSLPVRAAVWLLLFEWFRIYFQSGVVKLMSGDPTWRNLTAMYEYYQNGPLPTWVGWYLQHLPWWFHKGTAGATLLMELVLVWMAFGPRWMRIVCFWVVTVWQAGVILTANYAFLNYLVLVLGFWLLDDRYCMRLTPMRWRGRLEAALAAGSLVPARLDWERARAELPRATGWTAAQTAVAGFFLLWVGYVTAAEAVLMFDREAPLPAKPIALLEPFRIANSYGLFAVMTPHRYEIEFEGSNDGVTWTAYPFRYKPQDVTVRPGIYAPYQPRFDWNLWFASLAPWEQSPIVPLTEERLLDGDEAVLGLFAGNPFAGAPPKYVRATLWQYWFTTWDEKRATGAWWRRERLGTFAPTVVKRADGKYGEVAAAELSGPPGD